MSKSHRICEICGIQEVRLSEKIFFAKFPRDVNRCAEWVKVVGKEDLAYMPVMKLHDLRHICEVHFSKRDFTKTRTRLKKCAVPKLHLKFEPLSNSIMAEFLHLNSQETPSTSTSQDTQTTTSGCSTFESTNVMAPTTSPDKQRCSVPIKRKQLLATSTDQNLPVMAASANKQTPSTSIASTTSSDHEGCSVPVKKKRPLDTSIFQNLPDVPSTSTSQDTQPSTSGCSTFESTNDVTPRKKKLMALLRKTKCTLSSLRKSAKLIEELSSPVLKELVMSALKNQKRKPRGKRWTTKNKISCLSIYKRSPKAYRYLQHVIPLPSVKTLTNIVRKVPMKPGINNVVLEHLKKYISKINEKDKFCVLCFDEMALKRRVVYNPATDHVEGYCDYGGEDGRSPEQADHALVFLIQGVRKKFKQPIGFFFTKDTVASEKLAILIKNIIENINITGFKVTATVCDQGATNRGALNLLKEWHNGKDNYFICENEKVYIIYDVPHLIKSVRNNFLKNGYLHMDGKVAKWSHLQEVEEQNRNFLYMTKITPNHINPKYRAKMRVKLAAQIFSQTVAAVLKLLSKTKENEHRQNELMESALIIENLNRLFDFTNGPSNAQDIKPGIRENVSEKTRHIEVWNTFKKKLETVTFTDERGQTAKNVKCIEGFRTTLESLKDIWSLTKKAGFKYLNLRQLNQDALENLFGLIRQHSPTNHHPTCSSFMGAIKAAAIAGMTAPHSRGSNCEKDVQTALTDFHEIVFGSKMSSVPEETPIKIAEVEEEVPTISIPENDDLFYLEKDSELIDIREQPLTYVSGYIASVLLQKEECATCRHSLSVLDPTGNPSYDLIQLREWWSEKRSLTYPSQNLCHTVKMALNIFEKEGIPNLHRQNLCQWLVTLFYSYCDVKWLCPDHTDQKVKIMFYKLGMLFIRRQCQRMNITLASNEENSASANKKGQQAGLSK